MALVYPSFDATLLTPAHGLASLASDTNLLAGRQSAVIDCMGGLYEDFLLYAKTMTGTSPTTGRSIEYWLIGSVDGTLWPDTVTGAGDAARTLSATIIKNAICVPMQFLETNATSNQPYYTRVWSARSLFGELPAKFVVWSTHNTVAALNATSANHALYVEPVKRNIN